MLPTMQQAPSSLHDHAVQAQQNVHELAVGLAHAGANPQAVQQLTQMSKILGQISSALASGPPIGQDAERAQQGQQPPGPPPPGPPGPPPPGPPGAPPGGPPGPPPPGPPAQGGKQTQHAAFGAATHALHEAMIASANRQPPPQR